ncbi:MAG TPA: single-stranded DNA-binding protein [Spirochaetota bacterium]|nr:single-stranded DNA-binding protein [Spirochaetota bacterium]
MRDLNQVIIIGRLTRNPEIKYTAAGLPVTKFTIANNGGVSGQGNDKKELVNFFDVTVWGNHAVNCEKYLKKGSLVAVDGHLRQNRWVDQATGKNQSKVEIVANGVQFLTPQGQNQADANQTYSNQGMVNNQNQNFPNQQNNYQNKQQNSNQNISQNVNKEQKDFIPNPWNDTDSNFNNYEDPFSNGGGSSDDDIPF